MKTIAIHAFNPGPITGAGNWTWLLPGNVPTLIDAGVGDARHLDAIDEALAGAQLAQVIVTHGHTDHASGAQAINRRFPSARFLKMPWAGPDARWPVDWQPIADGEALEAGDTRLVVVHTPGHSPDHVCLWHEQTRTLFGGDLVIKGSTVWIPASQGGNLTDYVDSLRRVLALAPDRVLPAHGPTIDDPAAVLRAYIDHRLEREEQIVDALRGGAIGQDAIATKLYKDLNEKLLLLARESITAHLLKLEAEGRARRDGDAWHIIDP